MDRLLAYNSTITYQCSSFSDQGNQRDCLFRIVFRDADKLIAGRPKSRLYEY